MNNILKRCFIVMLALTMVFPLISCQKVAPISTDETEEESKDEATKTNMTKETEKTAEIMETVEKETKSIPRDGKKVIFIGDSFIYYGETVLEKTVDKLDLSQRVNDEGYFYQLCKLNGQNVSVTNWTFGSHGIGSIVRNKPCTVSTARACYGAVHVDHLTDKYYDVVVISPGRNTDTFVDDLTFIKEMFSKENPDVKLVCLCSTGVYGLTDNQTVNNSILNNLKTAENMGYTVVDWGGLVNGIAKGNIKVPNSKYTYEKNTFVIRKSESDGHHPNQLAGYITSLMAYCAITGEKAEGQPYSFATDSKINSKFSVEKFKTKNYVNSNSNYDQILSDKNEITQIQKLIDDYLAKKSYKNYNFAD